MRHIITIVPTWSNKKLWIFISKCLLLTLGVNIFMGFLLWLLRVLDLLTISSFGPPLSNKFEISVLLYCLIFPTVETFIFQYIPYVFMRNENRTVLLSAAFFGICHLYNPVYCISATAMGAVFMSAYIQWNAKPNRFIVIAVVHAIHNLITLVALHYLKVL